MYSIAWEGESNPSLLKDTKVYRDPVTIEQRDNQDSVTQESVDKNFPREENIASHSIAGAPHSDTHSSRDYIKTSKLDIRIPADAPFENEDTSNARHDSSFRQDTDSTASTNENVSTDQDGATIPIETFSRGGENNLLPNPNQNFPDSNRFYTGSKFSFTTMAHGAINFLSLLFLDFFLSFFHLTTIGIFHSVEKKQKNLSNYSYQIHHQKHHQQKQSFSFLKYRNENDSENPSTSSTMKQQALVIEHGSPNSLGAD